MTLAAVVTCYTLLLTPFGRRERPGPSEGPNIAARIDAGQRALAEGDYRLAVARFDAADDLHARHPGSLSAAAARRLAQLARQAALLADLSSESLQEILLRAAGLRNAEEWQAQFAERYRGRAVVFDDHVQRTSDGRCRLLTYEVRAGGEPARVELTGLKVLGALPLDRPQRLLFGARLADIAREPPGTWVVRFLPDSGVLLTDPGAAASCGPVPLDGELRAVLARQAEWLADLQ
jgi:hypothetical protein